MKTVRIDLRLSPEESTELDQLAEVLRRSRTDAARVAIAGYMRSLGLLPPELPGTFSNVLPAGGKPSLERLREAMDTVRGDDGAGAVERLERAGRLNPVPPALLAVPERTVVLDEVEPKAPSRFERARGLLLEKEGKLGVASVMSEKENPFE